MSASDVTGDVYDNVAQVSLPQIRTISASRSRASREIGERERQTLNSDSLASTTAHEDGSMLPHFRLRRSSTESATRQRTTHRNRFFGDPSEEKLTASMMEQGMAPIPEATGSGAAAAIAPSSYRIDKRCGQVSPQAMRTNTGSDAGSNNEEPRQSFNVVAKACNPEAYELNDIRR